MTTLDLTAHTTVRDLDRPVLVERSELHRRSGTGHDVAKTSLKGVVPVNESNDPATALSVHDAAHQDGGPAAPVVAPSRPQAPPVLRLGALRHGQTALLPDHGSHSLVPLL